MKKGEEYWNSLSNEDKIRILKDNDFWEGFSTNLWKYLPEMLKTFLAK